MKKLILTALLAVVFALGAMAQNRSIEFEQTRVWKEILAKAEAENKLIFVDCYTDWCGPCKMLAANVFTQDKVADFFNANFVNAQLEMEKDADGVILADVWGIKAYPTMVFVDSRSGEVVHRLVGAGQAEWLIDGARMALNPEGNLGSLTARYEVGERSPEFVKQYLTALKSAYMSDEQAQVAEEYLNNLTVDQMTTADNWLLIRDNISDPLSKPLRTVMAEREKFYAIPDLGQRSVDRFLAGTISSAAAMLARWQPGMGEFNQVRYDRLLTYLRGIDFPAKAPAVAWLETSQLVRDGDWDGLRKKMQQVEAENILDQSEATAYHQYFIETFALSSDPADIDLAIADLDRRIEQVEGNDSSAWFYKAGLAESKYRILSRAGRELPADNAKLEQQEYEKKGEDASGNRTQRAVRMG